MMNKRERENLNFLMNLDDDDFTKWAEDMPLDDVAYALELIQKAKAELEVQALEIAEEVQDVEGLDCTMALDFINRVKKEIL
jgi:hypothetical protein